MRTLDANKRLLTLLLTYPLKSVLNYILIFFRSVSIFFSSILTHFRSIPIFFKLFQSLIDQIQSFFNLFESLLENVQNLIVLALFKSVTELGAPQLEQLCGIRNSFVL